MYIQMTRNKLYRIEENKTQIKQTVALMLKIASKQIQNVYRGTIPCYNKKLHPIDKSETEMHLKSFLLLTQIATQ